MGIHHVLSFAKRPRGTPQNFPPPRPAQEEHSAPRTHSQLRLARSHATHETKTKTKRSRSPGSGLPSRLPLNLRLVLSLFVPNGNKQLSVKISFCRKLCRSRSLP